MSSYHSVALACQLLEGSHRSPLEAQGSGGDPQDAMGASLLLLLLLQRFQALQGWTPHHHQASWVAARGSAASRAHRAPGRRAPPCRRQPPRGWTVQTKKPLVSHAGMRTLQNDEGHEHVQMHGTRALMCMPRRAAPCCSGGARCAMQRVAMDVHIASEIRSTR